MASGLLKNVKLIDVSQKGWDALLQNRMVLFPEMSYAGRGGLNQKRIGASLCDASFSLSAFVS